MKIIVSFIHFDSILEKKDIFPKSKSKIESSVSENIPLKTFKVVQSNKEINENQHSTTNFEDSLNYGSEEDNIINDKKYKESKSTNRYSIIISSQVPTT